MIGDTPLARFVGSLPEGSRLSKNGDGWTARCPGHPDRHASLSVGEGRDGRVLIRCFAGCAVESVVDALGLRMNDLFADNGHHDRPNRGRRSPQEPAESPSMMKSSATSVSRPASAAPENGSRFAVTEEDVARWGATLLADERVLGRLSELRGWTREVIEELGLGLDGGRVVFPVRDSAGILVGITRYAPNPERRDGPKMVAAPGSRRELFPAPETVSEGDDYVWLVEGEADCITATSIGLPAIALPGVQSWRSEWGERFRGRRVIVFFDSDAPGREAARRVAADLAGVAGEVRVVDLDPDRDDGYDLSDLVLAGMNGDRTPAAYASGRQYLFDTLARSTTSTTMVEPARHNDTAGLLDTVENFYRRFVATGTDELCALTFWTAHAHAVDAAETTPYVHVTSAEKSSGKTRVLEVGGLLVPRPMEAANVSDAALFRAVATERVTVLMDEIDTVFGPKARDREDLRGLLNAGYRRGQSVWRMGGANKTTLEKFEVFGAKMLAGIGDLPDTLASRCIRIRMERKTASEPVERLRVREARKEAEPVRTALESWAAMNVDALRDARPTIPDELGDRLADVWEPLLAIADLAGGEWPERARAAAIHLAGRVSETSEESTGIRLLGDIRSVFDRRGCDRIATATLIEALCEDEEAPWGDWRGKPITPRALAGRLRAYGVRPKVIRVDDGTPRGFLLEDFDDAWRRYLPSPPSVSSTSQVQHPQHWLNHAGLSPISKCNKTPSVADSESASNPYEQRDVADVADRTPDTRAEGGFDESPDVPDDLEGDGVDSLGDMGSCPTCGDAFQPFTGVCAKCLRGRLTAGGEEAA